MFQTSYVCFFDEGNSKQQKPQMRKLLNINLTHRTTNPSHNVPTQNG